MNESKNSQNQNSKTNKAQNNSQNKMNNSQQTPPPATPNRAHTQMNSGKNSKNSK